MMPQAYVMLRDSQIEPAAVKGSTVYDCLYADYGCANDDTRIFGHEHMTVTLDPEGNYPFFTVPARDIEKREK